MDYSISWQYIVNAMKEKGFPPDSFEKREFAFFRNKVEEVWTEYFDKLYEAEKLRLSNITDTIRWKGNKMNNKEWLSTLSANDWYEVVHDWLFHKYSMRYDNSYAAILDWLNEDHKPIEDWDPISRDYKIRWE